MPSPLTEDDLLSLANKFEQWKEYLASIPSSSATKEFPSFPQLFNCISSIHQSFFKNTTTTDPTNNSIIAGKNKRRRDLPIENIPYRSNNTNTNNNNNKLTIADIPKEVFSTILEYLFPHNRQHFTTVRPFVRLALVSKLWYRMIRMVRISIHHCCLFLRLLPSFIIILSLSSVND